MALTVGAKVTLTLWAAGGAWDIVCVAKRLDRQTISDSIADGLVGRYRVLVNAALIANVTHLYHLAYQRGRMTRR